MQIARVITEISAPWLSNIVLFLTLGLALDAVPAGLGAALFTGVLPMVAIVWMQRRGQVSDHHVTKAQQRSRVFLIIAVLLGILCLYLALVDTPREIWVIFAAAVVFIAVYAFITKVIGIKLSVHVGLWVCVYGFLAISLSSWWFLAVAATSLVWWSRIKLAHHTNKEAGLGFLVGFVLLVVASISV